MALADSLELTELWHRQQLDYWKEEAAAAQRALDYANEQMHQQQAHIGTIAILRMRQEGLLPQEPTTV